MSVRTPVFTLAQISYPKNIDRLGLFLIKAQEAMTIPFVRKVNGKKFLWDGVTFDGDAQAQHVMEDYAKEGFEVEKFVEDGHYLVYSRRAATVAKSGS